jgi:hypothetical protein
MAGRSFAYGVVGWVVPGILAIPFAPTHETVGGQAMFVVGAVWLFLLGPLGCAIAGWRVSRVEARTVAFWSGLAGVIPAVIVVGVWDNLVTVVGIGPVAFLLVIPLLVGYTVGFAIGSIVRRRT